MLHPFSMLLWVLLLLVAGCRTAAPTTPVYTTPVPEEPPLSGRPPAAEPKPYNWKNDASLLQEEAEKFCRAERPDCRHPAAGFNAGAEHVNGQWACVCDECKESSECKSTQYCGSSGPQCSEERVPFVCIDGTEPPAVDCQPFQGAHSQAE